MNISIIVAISTNHVIGVDNKLPWHLPADLQYFKTLTIGHPILMGRKTYDSIGRPLPNRENIIITQNRTFHSNNLIIKHSIEEAIDYCIEKGYEDVFIIGGDGIYKQTISIADTLYITRVDINIENGTAFFPEIDKDKWKLISSDSRTKDDKNKYNYTFEVYEKTKLD